MEIPEIDIMHYVMEYGPGLVKAILVILIGLWVIGVINKLVKRAMKARDMEAGLQSFLGALVSTLLKVMLFITAAGMLGIEMTSFIAILGAAGLAIGMALSGTLQNFAGGVMVMLFKPYQVGDYIEAQGYAGTVSQIMIFNTILKTPDNKVIIIPNAGISSGALINFSKEATRRVDWTFGIGYGDDYQLARNTLMEMIQADDRILKDPEPFIGLGELGDSSVNLTTRAWVKSENYWGVFFDMNEKVYKKFEEVGLNIPYPQMDVHVHQQNAK